MSIPGLGSAFNAAGDAVKGAGATTADRTQFGNIIVQTGNPLQNVGAILNAINTGPATSGANPLFVDSALMNADRPYPQNPSTNIAMPNPQKLSTLGWLGIGAIAVAGFMFMKN